MNVQLQRMESLSVTIIATITWGAITVPAEWGTFSIPTGGHAPVRGCTTSDCFFALPRAFTSIQLGDCIISKSGFVQ